MIKTNHQALKKHRVKNADSTTKSKMGTTKDNSQRFKKGKPERRNKSKVRNKYNTQKGKK